jgi:hypothetical protein
VARVLTKIAAAAVIAVAARGAIAEGRSLAELYPKLDPAVGAAMGKPGGYSASAGDAPQLLPASDAGKVVAKALEGRKHSFLVETLTLVPGVAPESKLELYNAMTRYRSLSGVTYSSKSHGTGSVLFSDVTRIADSRKGEALPDETVAVLPERVTEHLRLKDANFGLTYYKADLDTRAPGIVLALSNSRSLSYLLIPVVGEGGIFCIFYVEPVEEGLLIYSLSGGSISALAAKQVNLPSAVRKRAAAIASWLAAACAR